MPPYFPFSHVSKNTLRLTGGYLDAWPIVCPAGKLWLEQGGRAQAMDSGEILTSPFPAG